MAKSAGIAVEGCGMVTPFAVGRGSEVLSRAQEARCQPGCAYWRIPDDICVPEESLSAEVKRDRAALITASALVHACADAGVDLAEYAPERIGLVLGCGFAGQLGMIDFAEEVRAQSPRFVSPIHFPQTVGNYVAGVMSRAFRIQGPNLTIATGAWSGLNAVIKACVILDDASADIAIAGGYEILSASLVEGLGGSTHGDSNAEVWSEGACLYVLRRCEDSPRKPPRAVIREWSSSRIDTDVGDTFSVAAHVGRSLAAESAMRLAWAVASQSEERQRIVAQISDDHPTANLIVEVG